MAREALRDRPEPVLEGGPTLLLGGCAGFECLGLRGLPGGHSGDPLPQRFDGPLCVALGVERGSVRLSSSVERGGSLSVLVSQFGDASLRLLVRRFGRSGTRAADPPAAGTESIPAGCHEDTAAICAGSLVRSGPVVFHAHRVTDELIQQCRDAVEAILRRVGSDPDVRPHKLVSGSQRR